MVNISFNIEYIILWQDTSFMDDLIASIATQTNKKTYSFLKQSSQDVVVDFLMRLCAC